MGDSLESQLRQTLAGTHSVERELPGGGLSRVFLGSELRFQRQVVIKVLPPDYVAGLSAERFERGVQDAIRRIGRVLVVINKFDGGFSRFQRCLHILPAHLPDSLAEAGHGAHQFFFGRVGLGLELFHTLAFGDGFGVFFGHSA